MRRNYSRFIKVFNVILIIVISSITNRYASEVNSLISATNHRELQSASLLNLPKKKLSPDEGRTIQSTNQHAQTTQTRESISDPQSTIYSSLIKILQNMKHQIDKEKLESRIDSKRSTTDTYEMPTDLFRNGRPSHLLKSNEIAGSGLNNFDTKSSRNTRNVKKTQVEQVVTPSQIDSSSSSQDQDQNSDIFNEPLRENFNEVGGGLATIAEEDNKTKKVTYSSYLGSDQVPISTASRKPSAEQFTEIINSNPPLQQPVRLFSPRFEDLSSKWIQQSNTYLDASKPSSYVSYTSKSPKSTGSFTPPSQDVSFNDFDQQTPSGGFSTAYNEPNVYQPPTGEAEDAPSEAIPLLATNQRANPKPKHSKQYGTKSHRTRGTDSPPIGKQNFRYAIDNEYLNGAQFEQQEEDGNRWPKVSSNTNQVAEFPVTEQGPRASRVPTNQLDYSGIRFQQISPTNYDQRESLSQNRRHRNHKHQAQQQQVYYSLVSAPPSGSKIATSGGQQRSVAQQISQPQQTAHIYELSPSGATQSHSQRDLVNQPQTIQITAVPGGLNNNPAFFRLNGGGPNVAGGVPIALLNNGALLDPSGRQVVMVNADRRQIDWSFLIWPLLVVVGLPLILSLLFVPIFMKSLVLFIQILQSLGLMMPISAALGLGLASGSSLMANVTAAR